jgi:hypothetical protein
MAKRPKRQQESAVTHDEAMRIARGRQRPGQTREQTKLIAQGIQEGIRQYRQQQNARARELDRKLKKVKQQIAAPAVAEVEVEVREKVVCRQHWLPWILLVISWLAVAAYLFVRA